MIGLRRALFPFGWSNPTKLALVLFFANLYVYLPVFTLYLQSHDLNLVQINSLWGIIVATMFLAEVPTGVLADRMGRARSVQAALACQLLGEVLFLWGDHYGWFAVAAIAGGIGFAFASGSAEALVYDSLLRRGREGEVSRAMGFISAAQRTANLIAFSAGGLLAVHLTPQRFRLGIAITAGMVAVGWLISFTLSEAEATTADEERVASLELLREGIAALGRNRRFRRLALLALATIPFGDYLLNLYPPRFVAVGAPPVWLGWGLALASLVGIAGARYAHRLEARMGSRRALLWAAALPGFLYLLFALSLRPVPAVAIFCLLGGSFSLKGPIFSHHLNRHIASRNRATLLSLINMAGGVYQALMGLVIGGIADASLTAAFVFMGTVVLAGAAILAPRGDGHDA